MARKRREVVTDIPSDSDSIDGLCDSDMEDDGNIADAEDEGNEKDEEDNEEEEVVEVQIRNGKSNEKWLKKRISKDDTPFVHNFGPNLPDDIESPSDIFSVLFSNDLLELIVKETNHYAKQHGRKGEPITKEELLIFLGINIMMGIKKLPSYRLLVF